MIWIVGCRGMLGTELTETLARHGTPVLGTDRELDFTDPSALEHFAATRWPQGDGPSWIVNCAAYTAVDKAETEVERAQALNVEGPRNLARLAAKIGARLLHISTDYVFDGRSSVPYTEADPPQPTGVYGRTKAEGERVVQEEEPSSLILRTAWLYGKHGPNFVFTMLRLMNERDSIGVVADQRGSPTWAGDLAYAISRILDASAASAGIYHYTNSGETTWFEFAQEIYRLGRENGLVKKACTIKALTTAEYPTPAQRPAYSVLSKEKIRETFGIVPPTWQDSLAKFFTTIDKPSF